MNEYSFPSLGEVTRFAIDALGILPRKRSNDEFDEKNKKRIQKKLSRLSKEEGKLLENFTEIFKELDELLRKELANELVANCVLQAFEDLFVAYRETIRKEGTYYTRKDTIKWFCLTLAIPRIAITINKYFFYSYHQNQQTILLEFDRCFLPSRSNNIIHWPLAKSMESIHNILDINPERFFHSHRNANISDSEEAEQKQNLENARKWLKGAHVPSWPTLKWTYFQSFERLNNCDSKTDRITLPVELKNNFITVLFLARLSTYIFKKISEVYGEAYMFECIDQFKLHYQWFENDLSVLKKLSNDEILRKISITSVSKEDCVEIIHKYWYDNLEKFKLCAREFDNDLQAGKDIKSIELRSFEMELKYGEYATQSALQLLRRPMDDKLQTTIPEMLSEYFRLKKEAKTESEIEIFKEKMKASGIYDQFTWIPLWLKAVLLYKRENYKEAMEFAEPAFLNAKYSAGEKQYNILNLYAEIAAKNGDKRKFKKCIEWARFIGVDIRWLRDKNPTEENIDAAYHMHKIGKYSQF